MPQESPAVTAMRGPEKRAYSLDGDALFDMTDLPGVERVKDGVKTLFSCEKAAKDAAEKAHLASTGCTAAPPPTPATGDVAADSMFSVYVMTARPGYATVSNTLRPGYATVSNTMRPSATPFNPVSTSTTTATYTATSPVSSSETHASSKSTITETWGPGFNGCPHPDPATTHSPPSAKPARRVDSMYEMNDDVFTDDDDDENDAHNDDDGSDKRGRSKGSKVVDGSRVRRQVWASGG